MHAFERCAQWQGLIAQGRRYWQHRHRIKRAGEGCCLMTIQLIRLIEEAVEVWNVGEHVMIEELADLFSIFLD